MSGFCVDEYHGQSFSIYLGDSCQTIQGIPNNSVGLSVFSPPFSNLYIYSDDIADMGNCADDDEFFGHFGYLIPEIKRITKPGRLCAVHCKDLPTYKNRDGASGLSDFPGGIIREFIKHGWAYHSRITIWKDPVIEMQRTKNHGLLYKELCKDSSCSRQGMADYIVIFRRWDGGEFGDPVTGVDQNAITPSGHLERFERYVGLEPPDLTSILASASKSSIVGKTTQNKEGRWPHANPFRPGSEEYRLWSILVWQKYASPVWFDISQTNVLNGKVARSDQDEKHICPLQLDVIERLIHLYSNPGDVVYSPFTGIGSEGFVSVEQGRKFVGGELKREYFDLAVEHIREVEERMSAPDLFSLVD